MLDLPGVTHEQELSESGYSWVVGLDEAGRGALAGPVFAGAVVLPSSQGLISDLLALVRDSKQLTPAARDRAFELIVACSRYMGVGVASAAEVDEHGIARATRLAWERAIGPVPDADFLLLDAFRLPESQLPQRPIIRGDAECLSIASASVVAKVTRDRHMREVDTTHSVYGFERNKGYGTPEHLRALHEHGPCRLHRRSFAPVRRLTLDPMAGND